MSRIRLDTAFTTTATTTTCPTKPLFPEKSFHCTKRALLHTSTKATTDLNLINNIADSETETKTTFSNLPLPTLQTVQLNTKHSTAEYLINRLTEIKMNTTTSIMTSDRCYEKIGLRRLHTSRILMALYLKPSTELISSTSSTDRVARKQKRRPPMMILPVNIKLPQQQFTQQSSPADILVS